VLDRRRARFVLEPCEPRKRVETELSVSLHAGARSSGR
jgi:hypothetical protein